ncbi:MAG: prepilin-type N-terminal cleavage/methylation domain-containing protein [Phycisphaerales bacterium]|nr:MAG: prepilin-type N-terminal cleavage/methylation domain-containing protein [Phycisphaerales bacterium]
MDESSHRQAGDRTGFTLIEILLAMLITSILVLGVNTAYRQAHLIWSKAENLRPVYHTARIVTDTLRQELSCIYCPPADSNDGPRFALVSLPGKRTELLFYTLTPAWTGDIESSRVARIRYQFGMDSDTQEMVLVRFEQPCSGEKPIAKETSQLVARGLSDLAAWVADPNSGSRANPWKRSYKSKDAPPRALKVRMNWPATDKFPATSLEFCTLIPCESTI